MEQNAVILLIFAIIVGVYLWRRRPGDFSPPETKPASEQTFRSFQRVPSLFVNSAEFAFFHSLQKSMPPGYFVMSKVRLEDIIRVKPGIANEKIRWHLRQRVKSRHVDFLIINDKGHPVMAIELDGGSHNDEKTKNADDLKNGLFRAAQIPFLRVRTGENFEKVSRKIVSELNVS